MLAACAPGAEQPLASGATPDPGATATLPPAAFPLEPAELKADPFSLLSWLFTPVFQTFFIALVLLDQLVGNIAFAIVLLTIILKLLLTPVFRRQIVTMRRMQLLSPELKEIQRRYKSDRTKQQTAMQQLYRERGVSPAAGCLPVLLQMLLLIPMYSVFSQGLQNFDVQPMMDVFGFRILDLACPTEPVIVQLAGQPHVANPCLNPEAFGINWGVPEVFIGQPGGFFSGLSLLAIISALFQLVLSRMSLPGQQATSAEDQSVRTQRQMAIFLPFISLIYGSILPAGLFLYWIVSTIVSIIQQFLTAGWGGMFPLFGWTPAFAVDHKPRFPVALPAPTPTTREAGAPARPTRPGPAERSASAASTVRPSQRGRQGRRGRRR
jgi:YidC/Oxa1 family membrane protein insertase